MGFLKGASTVVNQSILLARTGYFAVGAAYRLVSAAEFTRFAALMSESVEYWGTARRERTVGHRPIYR